VTTTPMSAARLLAVIDLEGVDVREYLNWRTHERDDETGKAFGPVNGVVIHHTAGASSLGLCYNGTSSLPGPLCHTHLGKTGVANMLSAGRANHAGTFAQNAHNAVLAESPVHPYPDASEPIDGNDHYYGLEIENRGNGTDPYPWVQYVAAVKWATAICRAQGWNQDSVIGHKEGTRRKIDPKGPVQGPDGKTFDFTMNRFRADVKAALALPAGVWPNQEDPDVALSAEDIEKVANAVTAKLIAGGGVMESNDVRRVWVTDGIIESPDGKTSANPYWAPASYIRDTFRKLRDVEADVTAVKAKMDSLATGGVDLDALAAKVADVLARRLAE
jgi:hypothetical protein